MTQAEFRQQLAEAFDPDELETLCFDLGIDDADLPGRTHRARTAQLIKYCQRRRLLPQLVARCQALRPQLNWELRQEPPAVGNAPTVEAQRAPETARSEPPYASEWELKQQRRQARYQRDFPDKVKLIKKPYNLINPWSSYEAEKIARELPIEWRIGMKYGYIHLDDVAEYIRQLEKERRDLLMMGAAASAVEIHIADTRRLLKDMIDSGALIIDYLDD